MQHGSFVHAWPAAGVVHHVPVGGCVMWPLLIALWRSTPAVNTTVAGSAKFQQAGGSSSEC